MNLEAQYYLHKNGDVIYKPKGGVDPTSDFVVDVWQLSDVAKSPITYANWINVLYNLDANRERLQDMIATNELLKYIPELEPDFIRLGLIRKAPPQ